MYTKTETLELIRKAVTAHPNRRNPKPCGNDKFSACLYTSKNGQSHCIAGQLIKDTGATPPKWDVEVDIKSLAEGTYDDLCPGMAEYLQSTFDEESLVLLLLAQNIFDGGRVPKPGFPFENWVHWVPQDQMIEGSTDTPRRWKDALVLLERSVGPQDS